MIKKEENKKKSKDELQQILLENSISLQKVLTNLTLSLDNLSKQTERLLNLFEQSTRTIAEKDFEAEAMNKRISDKLDMLMNQNRTLAQGVSLVHERIQEPAATKSSTKELPPTPQEVTGYQKSISQISQK